MYNTDLRNELKIAKVKQWEVAEAMGVCEMTLVKWLRRELSDEKKQQVRQGIEKATADKL